MRTLSDLVELSPGFKAAVNLRSDLSNDVKAGGYIPTELSSEVLLDLAENIHPTASRRARLLTGTYGTGKSHLALVMCNIYRASLDSNPIKPVIEKLERGWPGKTRRLIDARKACPKPFLMVLLEGDEGRFSDALLRTLDTALAEMDLGDTLPNTAFTAAIRRIDELREKHPQAYKDLEERVKESGLISIEGLRENLRKYNSESYLRFCELHEVISAGAPFYHHHMMKPGEVYLSVVEKLVEEHELGGIVVIWDEFGRYMERVVEDPDADESLEIQQFAEACNGSGENQLHLYLICHRSLEEYAAVSRIQRSLGMAEKQEIDMRKVSGRFREFEMKSSDEEVFELIDQVIMQKKDRDIWQEFIENSRDYFDDWSDKAHQLKLFPTLSRDEIDRTVTIGSWPLNPMAAFCLPRLSQVVAQNERTLFTFLSDSGTDTMGTYISNTSLPEFGKRPPVFTVDGLWDYFSEQVMADKRTREIARRFQYADRLITPENMVAKRVIKALAILSIVQSDRYAITQEILSFSLSLSGNENEILTETLSELSSGSERILVRRRADGSYRFFMGTRDDFEDKIEQAAKDRWELVSPIRHLQNIWERLGLSRSIPAMAYSDDYRIERALVIDVASVRELENPQKWLADLGNGSFVDGYAIILLAENASEIRFAKEIVNGVAKHPQLLIGVPKEPLSCAVLLREHEAIEHLEKEQSNLYGTGAELREEWESWESDYIELLRNNLNPLFDPEERKLDWFVNGVEHKNITTSSKLRTLASEIMSNVFPLTPVISHETLLKESGVDTYRKYRIPVIDKIFLPDGPQQLEKETAKAQSHTIRAILVDNGILSIKGRKKAIEEPDEKRYRAMAEVWEEIDSFIVGCRETPSPMLEIVKTLRRSPYGLRTRCIPVIFAAVMRKYVLRGNISFQFQKTKTITEKISQINGELTEEIINHPERYILCFIDIGKKQEAVISGLQTVFCNGEILDDRESDSKDTVGELHKDIVKWWMDLPSHAQRTSGISDNTSLIRERIFRPLAREGADPHELILNRIPDMIRPKDQDVELSAEQISKLFEESKKELDCAIENLVTRLGNMLTEVFGIKDDRDESSAEAVLRQWFSSLPKEIKSMNFGGDAGLLSSWCRSSDSIAELDHEQSITRLAQDITGTPLRDWSDEMIERFRGRIEGAKNQIENYEPPPSPPVVPSTKEGYVCVSISGYGDAFTRTFIRVDEISQNGKSFENIIRSAIDGMGGALRDGECETILIRILKEALH